MRKFVTLIVILVIFSSLYAISFSGDWTSWRGPNANGISTEKNWKPEALNGNPNILWETNVGFGHSAVAVKGNFLYTMGNKNIITGAESVFTDFVYCLDANSGKEIWQYSYPCKDRSYPGPRTTPVLDGNYLYTLSWVGDLFCFNAQNGKVIWSRNLVADGLSKKPTWGFSGSPVIENDMLILTAGKAGLALNKKTGKIIWKSELKKCGIPSPVIFTLNGKRIAAISGEKLYYAVDVKTGKVLWSYKWETCNDPVVIDNNLFFSADKKGSALVAVNNADPKTLWTKKIIANAFQNSIVIDGYAYGFGWVKKKQPFQCIDLKTGDLKWSEDIGMWGALMAANGKLIILKGDGKLAIADASPESYKEITCADVVPMTNNKGIARNKQCFCWTAPVLVNGKIYARNNYGKLVCVDMQK